MYWSNLRRWSTAGLLILAALNASCGILTEPSEPRRLAHEVAPPQLILTNRTTEPVFYFVVAQNPTLIVDWYPCANAAVCPPLEPGGHMRIDFERIAGYQEGIERASLYWWHAEGARDGVQSLDRIRRVTIQLR